MRIALYEPDIPQNTGTILRTCACLGLEAHVIEPAGFPVTDRAFRRAGMDYLDRVTIVRHAAFADFEDWRHRERLKLVLMTTAAEQNYLDHAFQDDQIVLFGRESAGVPPAVHQVADHRLLIPVREGLRSLNIAVSVAMVAGEQLQATIAFDPADGDLDLYLVTLDTTILELSESLNATETVTWTAQMDITVYLVVLGVGQSVFQAPYALTLETSPPTGCVDDVHEPNDSFDDALPLPQDPSALVLCPGDLDVFTLELACGAHLELWMPTVADEGDLDVGVWLNPSFEVPALAFAGTEAETETLTLDAAPKSGTYYLVVSGFPAEAAYGVYDLEIDLSGACPEDALGGNTTPSTAASLAGADGELDDLAICCEADWFALDLDEGQEVIVLAEVLEDSGAVGLSAFSQGGLVELAYEPVSPEGAIVGFTATAAGIYHLRALGTTGTHYALLWTLEE